jgi:hypothetical protein
MIPAGGPRVRARLDETIEMLPANMPVAAAQAALPGSARAETVALDKENKVHG